MLVSLFNKVRCLLKFTENKLQNRCFPVYIANFQEHLFWRTSAMDCFWLIFYFVISLFVFGCLYNYEENYYLSSRRKYSMKLDYVIQWRTFLKSMSKSFKYGWWSFKEKRYSFKEWPLNLWWISNKSIMELGNITKAATF